MVKKMGLLDIFKRLFAPNRKKSSQRIRQSKSKKKVSRSQLKRKSKLASGKSTSARRKERSSFRKNVSSRLKKEVLKGKKASLPAKRTKAKRGKARVGTKASIRRSQKVAWRAKREGGVKETEIGLVTHYFGKISVGIIKLKAPLRVGDKIHIKGANDDFYQLVTSMQLNHQDISYAPRGAEIGIKVNQRVHENDKVYRVVE
jgi:putative protease